MQRTIAGVVVVVAAAIAVVAAVLGATCSVGPAATGRVAVVREPSGPATVVGRVGSKVRVPLPDLAPSAFAEIETRAIRRPAQPDGAGREIDSMCTIWLEEGAKLGALGGWTISGNTGTLESGDVRASVKSTALDDTRVRYEVDTSLR
jgi:hypothetical protein